MTKEIDIARTIKKILYPHYSISKSEGEFPVVNCRCSGEVDDRYAKLKCHEENNLVNRGNPKPSSLVSDNSLASGSSGPCVGLTSTSSFLLSRRPVLTA